MWKQRPGAPPPWQVQLAGLGDLPAGPQLLEHPFPHSAGKGPLSTGCRRFLCSQASGFCVFPVAQDPRLSQALANRASDRQACRARSGCFVFRYWIRGSKRHVLCPLGPSLELARPPWLSADPAAASPSRDGPGRGAVSHGSAGPPPVSVLGKHVSVRPPLMRSLLRRECPGDRVSTATRIQMFEAEPSRRGEGVRAAGFGPRDLCPFLAAEVEML